MKRAKIDTSKHNRIRLAIIALIIAWTYLYNLLIKGQGPVRAFFEILNTISDDFVMGTSLTIGVGLGIVVVYSSTRLYTQIIANVYSFRILERLFYEDLARGHYLDFFRKLIRFEDQPLPEQRVPTRAASLCFSFAFIYAMSVVYVLLFSEALFFISWSAGVDLQLNENNLLFLPTLALAIPFSARVMAYLRYPYAQDYADFMPGAVFVLLVVAALGAIFQSQDQQFFLKRVLVDNPDLRITLLRNGVFLAFIPVFFEGGYWLLELSRTEGDVDEEGEPTSTVLAASEAEVVLEAEWDSEPDPRPEGEDPLELEPGGEPPPA